jgi:urease accessory protein
LLRKACWKKNNYPRLKPSFNNAPLTDIYIKEFGDNVMTKKILSIGFLLAAFTPMAALAHTGTHNANAFTGFMHPLTGLDHLLAMFAAGLWASRMGGKNTLLIPAAFSLTMVLGWLMAINGIAMPKMELSILLSVIALGTLVALPARMAPALCMAIAGAFAFAHGAAHGVEMPVNGNGVEYMAGFLLASVVLQAAGILAHKIMEKLQLHSAHRFSGLSISAMGLYLAFS